MSQKALISGITGQDGSYLAELLLSKGYEVHGLIRRSSSFNTERIDHLYQDPHVNGVKLFLHYADLSDSASLTRLVHEVQPDEVYHLGAQSHVRVSFDIPEYTGDVTAIGEEKAATLEKAAAEGLTPLGFMRRYGAVEIKQRVGKIYEEPVDASELDDIREEGCYAMIIMSEPGQSIIASADKNLDVTDKAVSRLRATKAPAVPTTKAGAPSTPAGVTRKPPTQ